MQDLHTVDKRQLSDVIEKEREWYGQAASWVDLATKKTNTAKDFKN